MRHLFRGKIYFSFQRIVASLKLVLLIFSVYSSLLWEKNKRENFIWLSSFGSVFIGQDGAGLCQISDPLHDFTWHAIYGLKLDWSHLFEAQKWFWDRQTAHCTGPGLTKTSTVHQDQKFRIRLLAIKKWTQDELLWGAAWLRRASEEDTYLEYIQNNGKTLGAEENINEFGWDNKHAGLNVLVSKVQHTWDWLWVMIYELWYRHHT